MGLFDRAITPYTDLTGIPTDRLLREYAATAKDEAAVVQAAAGPDLAATSDNIDQLDSNALIGTMVRGLIADELKRRGLEPSE
jgi:hypothetical protein